MKAIVLAGGTGSRLGPVTCALSKQLIPVYDKPMIYYPLATLMQAGLRDILLISTAADLPKYQALLADGQHLGIDLSYLVQPNPGGLAQAFVLAADFVGLSSVALILGDNLFYGPDLATRLQIAVKQFTQGALIFGYAVADPCHYGVIDFTDSGAIRNLVEKPAVPPSAYAIPGLYFYDNSAVDKSRSLKPSSRGELEITDLNLLYLHEQQLQVQLLDRGTAWLDTGTPSSLLQAANFIAMVEARQGVKIGCLEEIAARMGFISWNKAHALGEDLAKSAYGQYLLQIAQQELKMVQQSDCVPSQGSALWPAVPAYCQS